MKLKADGTAGQALQYWWQASNLPALSSRVPEVPIGSYPSTAVHFKRSGLPRRRMQLPPSPCCAPGTRRTAQRCLAFPPQSAPAHERRNHSRHAHRTHYGQHTSQHEHCHQNSTAVIYVGLPALDQVALLWVINNSDLAMVAHLMTD